MKRFLFFRQTYWGIRIRFQFHCPSKAVEFHVDVLVGLCGPVEEDLKMIFRGEIN